MAGARRAAAAGLAAVVAVAAMACAEGPTLANTRESPEAVARAVVAGLAARDAEGLRALALSEAEFRDIVWPRLPASRPERNVPWEYAWGDLHGKSEAHLAELLARWQDRGYALVSVAFRGDTTDHGAFRVHRASVLELRDADGRAHTARLFGSMIEMGGRYKAFSYVVD